MRVTKKRMIVDIEDVVYDAWVANATYCDNILFYQDELTVNNGIIDTVNCIEDNNNEDLYKIYFLVKIEDEICFYLDENNFKKCLKKYAANSCHSDVLGSIHRIKNKLDKKDKMYIYSEKDLDGYLEMCYDQIPILFKLYLMNNTSELNLIPLVDSNIRNLDDDLV